MSKLDCYAEAFGAFRTKVQPAAAQGDRVAVLMMQGTKTLLDAVHSPDEFSPCLCCGRVLDRNLLGPTARAVIGVPQDPEGTGYGALVCVGCAPVSHADLLRHFEMFVATAFVEGGHA
jgi:hypothetical protein